MESIHDRALKVASNFKKSHLDLLEIVREVDESKAYFEKKFTSTYDYCLGFLKISDNIASDLIVVSRKSRKVPELQAALENETISISKARRLTPVINQQNSSQWLELAQTLSKEKLQKEVARVNPQAAVQEKAKYITENRLKLELGVSEETMANLRKAQDIISQKKRSFSNIEETLDYVLREFVKKEDPVEKATRAIQRGQNKKDQVHDGPGHTDIPFERTPLNSKLEHQVVARDKNQCTQTDQYGNRCSERKWLQIHHEIPIKDGGQNQIENLKTLCFGHHQLEHRSTSKH